MLFSHCYVVKEGFLPNSVIKRCFLRFALCLCLPSKNMTMLEVFQATSTLVDASVSFSVMLNCILMLFSPTTHKNGLCLSVSFTFSPPALPLSLPLPLSPTLSLSLPLPLSLSPLPFPPSTSPSLSLSSSILSNIFVIGSKSHLCEVNGMNTILFPFQFTPLKR